MAEAGVDRAVSARVYAGIGLFVMVVVWHVVAVSRVFGSTVSSPTAVLRVLADDKRRATLLAGVRVTMLESLQGFVWALVAAAIVALIATLVPVVRRGSDQLGTIESAIPFVSLAPILLALFDRDMVPSAMAACTAYFPLYLAFVSGLAAGPRSAIDLLTVLGASRWSVLLRARIPAGLPVLTTGMKVAMPLAIVGAVIGEWFGSNGGVGPILLVAMRNYQMPTMWAAVVATMALALGLYGLCVVVDRIVVARFG
ncbi:ABC transporter permease subunit [Mycolicibacterium sp. CH28]|uniref:ABC transporter permease n=1 Tax=Mycolicibacterium sp. CH28 TaxID=2512237 RepID=UPI0010814374|nr:ABC transporter permease subunit [Mycolicibacterium sp. CH28]TGD85457.1 ABC transporter permease subunit [Mycolicibacterium sp. CH28]